MRTKDAFALTCAHCERDIEIPVADVVEGFVDCPRCQSLLEVHWPGDDSDPPEPRALCAGAFGDSTVDLRIPPEPTQPRRILEAA